MDRERGGYLSRQKAKALSRLVTIPLRKRSIPATKGAAVHQSRNLEVNRWNAPRCLTCNTYALGLHKRPSPSSRVLRWNASLRLHIRAGFLSLSMTPVAPAPNREAFTHRRPFSAPTQAEPNTPASRNPGARMASHANKNNQRTIVRSMPEYPQNNTSSRPQGRGGRNRRRRPGGPNSSQNNNSGHSGSRDRSQPRQEKKAPATAFQKFLHKVTLGLLGKPGEKPSTSASSYRAEPQRTPRTDRPERRPAGGNDSRPPRENRPPRQSQHTSSEVTGEKLYVGNLSYDASESDLFDLFNGSGKVKNAEVVVNSRTQRSKGFAFVTMMTIDDAKKAVAELNGKEYMGRPLVVGGAKPMPEREDRPARREPQVADDDVIRPPAEDEDEQPA